LVLGVMAIFICFGVILYGFGFLTGIESDNQVVLDMPLESYSVSLLGLMLFPFLLGIYGGIEIGGYFQKNSQKDKN
ncbi:hypothetical protein KJN74_03290, partial [Candidatus Bathyarchaeota archaeon]|nr:hypothetical protein [Candidatus Bathyarchaeota archaeon]